MSRRRWLIGKTLTLCSVPVVLIGAFVVLRGLREEAPYVAGEESEGITRSLDRSVDPVASRFRFTDVTAGSGIRFDHFPFRRTSQLPEDMGSGVAWGDFDGDGHPDLFFVNFAAPLGVDDADLAASPATDRLYRNRGDGTFEDVTAESGVGRAHRGMGASWADFDSDGDRDLFVTSWGENILWENRGDGTFRDVTRQASLAEEGFWTGASWSDFDRDGDLDLYVCGYVTYEPEDASVLETLASSSDFPFTLNPSSHPPHPNRLYVNRGNGTFEDRSEVAGVVGESGKSLGAVWADFDEDGWPDLYVANDVSDNALYRSRGDGTFENVAYEAVVADYRGAMGLAVGDWDGDLDLDLFVTHWIAQENALYSNTLADFSKQGEAGLLFVDDADRVGLGQIALDLIGWGTSFVDFDSDGWLDLLVVNGSTFQEREDPTRLVAMHPHLFWNRGPEEGFFEIGEKAGIRTNPPGVARGAACSDYDRDGDLDVVVSRHGAAARLLRNDTEGGRWVAFQLQAQSGHASGLGSRVVVHAAGKSLLRQAGPGPSYLSQDDPEVVVGLGDAAEIDSVEIRWFDGRREMWRGLAPDERWILEEGMAPRRAGQRIRAGVRRKTSPVHDRAVVADITTELSREEILRFWDLKKEADRLFFDGRWQEAAEVLGEMTRLDGRHEDSLYYRGNCFLEMERYEGAKECWDRLVQINPASNRAWTQLGVLHSLPEAGTLFDLEKAIGAFRRAHEINREESGPLILWGKAALARGDLAAAQEILSDACGMNDQATAAFYLSGYIAWRNGDVVRARELLERAFQSIVKEKPIHGVLGEGDTRSATMEESRRRARRRQLFASCTETLRDASPSDELENAFACVDRIRASLPPPGIEVSQRQMEGSSAR